MTHREQLTQLIDKALDQGYRWFEIEDLESEGYRVEDFLGTLTIYVSYRDLKTPLALSINDLLFGDNLSFPKACVGDEMVTITWAKGQARGYGPRHEAAAIQLVLLPDAERLPWLYRQVFGEEK